MQFLSHQNCIKFQTCSKPLRYRGDKSQWKSHLVYTCDFEVATLSATKIASSCCDKNRLCKRALRVTGVICERSISTYWRLAGDGSARNRVSGKLLWATLTKEGLKRVIHSLCLEVLRTHAISWRGNNQEFATGKKFPRPKTKPYRWLSLQGKPLPLLLPLHPTSAERTCSHSCSLLGVLRYFLPSELIISQQVPITISEIAVLLMRNWYCRDWQDYPVARNLRVTATRLSGLMFVCITVSAFWIFGPTAATSSWKYSCSTR